MRRTAFVVSVLIILMAGAALQQVRAAEGLELGVNGYVNVAFFYDSRQTVSAREGHFLLWPAEMQFDANQTDINATPSLNILAVQSRLTLKISGPSTLGAKTTGLMEGDYLGLQESDINGFRLRHAFVRLDWSQTSLLIGQYWNPMFVTKAYPSTVGSNAGVPFQPFARNPQIRLTHTVGAFQVLAAALSQRDYTSIGPQGGSSSYLRNAVLPDLHLHLQYDKPHVLFGAGGEYKQIKPRFMLDQGTHYNGEVSSFALLGYSKLRWRTVEWKIEGVYGENLADLLMLGGYAVGKEYPELGRVDYVNLRTASGWTDLSVGREIRFGVFAGYTQNLGSAEQIHGEFYSRGANIHHVYRIAPRVQFQSGNTRFALEAESTTAGYGTPNIYGENEDVREVSNLRILLATYYYF